MVYLMARLLNRALVAEVISDLLRCMQIKVIRRLQKLCAIDESTLSTGIFPCSLLYLMQYTTVLYLAHVIVCKVEILSHDISIKISTQASND
jgi:hypothetical protein